MTLHVVNGDSARAAVQTALPNADVAACRDVLSVGPLDVALGPDDLDALRIAFWRDVFGQRPLPHGAPLSALAAMCRQAARGDGLVLWVGAAASDQLFAAWALDALYDVRDTVDVSVIDLAAGGHGVRGPAELTPGGLAAVASPQPVSRDAWSACRQAWRSVSSPVPDAWPELAAAGLPMALSNAMRAMINRLPDRRRGLSLQDERLLSAAAGPGATRQSVLRTALTTGDARWRDLDSDAVGDAWLDWRLERMAAPDLARPLLRFDGPRVRATDFGSEVLQGRANAVEVNGIVDDVGGVRLRRGVPPWYRDGNRVVQVANV